MVVGSHDPVEQRWSLRPVLVRLIGARGEPHLGHIPSGVGAVFFVIEFILLFLDLLSQEVFSDIIGLMKYQILLFYKYVTIDDPDHVREAQRKLCEELGLKGRIIVAPNGINATVEGLEDATTAYMSEMQKDPRFADIVFKKSEGTGDALRKLQVRVRKDLVSDHTEEWGVDPLKETGKYLTAEELHEWIQAGKKFYIMDMRNNA